MGATIAGSNSFSYYDWVDPFNTSLYTVVSLTYSYVSSIDLIPGLGSPTLFIIIDFLISDILFVDLLRANPPILAAEFVYCYKDSLFEILAMEAFKS